jgi:heme oxygenase
MSLSAQLRHGTRTVHAHTEATFELDRWLAGRASYAALLARLWRFHTAAESTLARIKGWPGLTPAVDLTARRRAFRIEQDLAELGWPQPTLAGLDAGGPLRLAGLAEGLGCLYVVEGSAIGGRVIAARAHAALGPRLPTSFFADPVRNTGHGWNALRTTLDSFGDSEDALTRRSVIDAAHRTFAAFAATLTPTDRS